LPMDIEVDKKEPYQTREARNAAAPLARRAV
jgi:hypothetical protein